jgi:hypothetical protein
MRRLQGWICRLGGLFSKRSHEREFDAELSSHLQFHIDENLRANMTPDAARREALIRLGGVESTKERWRARLLTSALFGVTAQDPFTFAVVLALLVAVALFAVWVPARRATRVDPLVALRAE